MTDIHDKKIRSFNMSRVRAKDTIPEMVVRKKLFSLGYRYKLHSNNLPGKPDIVMPKYKAVIFVHGCFWHGHRDCKYAEIPKTRAKWWFTKISRNRQRDLKNQNKLKNLGWKVIIVYSCLLKKTRLENTIKNIIGALPQ